MLIATTRLRLRNWVTADRDAFAAMHADPDVMQDYGGLTADAARLGTGLGRSPEAE